MDAATEGITIKDNEIGSSSGLMSMGDGVPFDQSCSNESEFLDAGNCKKCVAEPNEIDGSEWGLCSERQLEELLTRNLEFVYIEAIRKIVSMGYSEEVARKAVSRNGHCCGGGDVLSNVVDNSLTCLSVATVLDNPEVVLGDLKQLVDYSLVSMICMLQQVRPQLTRGDAMWCLLMSDLHVGRASALEFPICGALKDGEIGSDTAEEGTQKLLHGGNLVPISVPIRSSPNLGSGSQGCDCESHQGMRFLGEDGVVNGFMGNTTRRNMPPAAVDTDGFSNCLNISTSVKSSMMNKTNAYAMPCFSEVARAGGQSPHCTSFGCSHSSMAYGMHHSGRDKPKGPSECLTSTKQQSNVLNAQNKSSSHMMVAAAATCPEIPSVTGARILPEHNEKSKETCDLDIVSSILCNLEKLHLDEKLHDEADQRDEMISELTHHIGILEKQLQERTEWAQKKALQAAKKLSNDLTELKMLRMEREEILLQKNKLSLEDTTMKKLSELESAFKKVNAQADRANASVKQLETENAEIRAEMVASKLNADESINSCLEVEKRAKKSQKKLLAWEKQNAKLRGDVIEEKKKNNQFHQELQLMKEARKEAEIKLKLEIEAKERAILQAEEERRAKEETEVNIARRQEALRSKIELDFQRHKDDIQRLEDELSRLKASSQLPQLNRSSNVKSTDTDMGKRSKASKTKRPTAVKKVQESSCQESKCNRKCFVCMKEDVSVVFLPCAHQVLCVGCNDIHEKQPKRTCPPCGARIEQIIRVYGISS